MTHLPRRHTSSGPVQGVHFPFWHGDVATEDPISCRFCGMKMDPHYDLGVWTLSYDNYASAHDETIRDPLFEALEPGHPHSSLRGDIVERKECLHICPACGWWIAEDRALLPAVDWQVWAVTLASAAVLETLSLDDISVPLQEVRRYLMRRSEACMSMHPRLFELTVASVFSDLGYVACATAYTHDGGVDVVMQRSPHERIGVQVKRHRGVVKVEKIRAFLGALVLGGFARGVFVSATSFSRGAISAARCSEDTATPIELIDASRFFDMLGYAQLLKRPMPEDCGIKQSLPLSFHLGAHSHLKAL